MRPEVLRFGAAHGHAGCRALRPRAFAACAATVGVAGTIMLAVGLAGALTLAVGPADGQALGTVATTTRPGAAAKFCAHLPAGKVSSILGRSLKVISSLDQGAVLACVYTGSGKDGVTVEKTDWYRGVTGQHAGAGRAGGRRRVSPRVRRSLSHPSLAAGGVYLEGHRKRPAFYWGQYRQGTDRVLFRGGGTVAASRLTALEKLAISA